MPEAPVAMPEVSTPPPPVPPQMEKRKAEPSVLPTLFGEGYGTYKTNPKSFIYSYAFVVAGLIAFILISQWLMAHRTEIVEKLGPAIDIVMPQTLTVGHDAGGGTHDPKPASKGVLPKISPKVPLAPPRVDPIPEPKLPVVPTVLGPTTTPPVLAQLGDPLGKIGGPPSNGGGSGGGIGEGSGGGVGNGHGAYRVGGGVSAPVATYQPEPDYSEEARKAKYQGEVELIVIVGTDGRAHDIRVARSLGLGLDEKAIESVKTWKFEPGKKDGIPVAVQVGITVEFRLY